VVEVFVVRTAAVMVVARSDLLVAFDRYCHDVADGLEHTL